MEQKNSFHMSNGYSEFPSYVERSSPKPRLLLIFIIVFFLVIAALAGLYFIGLNNNKNLVQSIPTVPTPTTTAVALPTEAPTPSQGPLERGDLTIAILNGSGIAGAARGVSSYLNGLGYTIGPIGNADIFTYRGLTVHVKQAKSAYLSLIEKDLREHDPDASISASVDDSIATDAEVIVGR